MEKRLNTKIVQICILSFAFLLLFNITTVNSEVRYLYDDLGQLHKVVDESGNVATYNYDMSGNLLSITRSTGGIGAPDVTGISPGSARAGDTAEITISGHNLLGAALKAENQGITISDTRANETSMTATFSLSFFSTLGPTTINVNTPFGSTSIAFLVDPPP